MGDVESGPMQLSFNPQLRVEFRGATVTSDARLLIPRELDERLGLGALIERHLSDPRTGRNSQFSLADLFRQSIYSRLAGYEDTNDAERLAEDPTFRMLASRERRDTSVALVRDGGPGGGTELPRTASPERPADSTSGRWSLTSLQQRLLKTGARLIRHARYFTLQLAESYLTGALFRQIFQRIERLARHPT